jgi:hypothetical protein
VERRAAFLNVCKSEFESLYVYVCVHAKVRCARLPKRVRTGHQMLAALAILSAIDAHKLLCARVRRLAATALLTDYSRCAVSQIQPFAKSLACEVIKVMVASKPAHWSNHTTFSILRSNGVTIVGARFLPSNFSIGISNMV